MRILTSLPKPPTASSQRVAWRWVAGFVLLCVLVQALLIPAQRINERTHFHVSSSSSNSVPAWTLPTPSQSVARALFVHREVAHDETQPHQHAGLQNHDHGARADVVYVSDHDTSSATRHTLVAKRLLLDQDGLWAALLPTLVIQIARVGHVKSTVLVSTRNELPLERPPRC